MHLINVLAVLVSAFQILKDSKITLFKVDSKELFTEERNDSHKFLTSLKGNCYDQFLYSDPNLSSPIQKPKDC